MSSDSVFTASGVPGRSVTSSSMSWKVPSRERRMEWKTAVTCSWKHFHRFVGPEHARVDQRPSQRPAGLRCRGDLLLGRESQPDGDLAEPLPGHGGLGAPHLAVLERDGALGARRRDGEHPREARLVHEGHEVGDGEAVQVSGQDAAGLHGGAAGGGRAAGDQQVGGRREQEEAAGSVRQRASDLVRLRDHAAVGIDVQEKRHPGRS